MEHQAAAREGDWLQQGEMLGLAALAGSRARLRCEQWVVAGYWQRVSTPCEKKLAEQQDGFHRDLLAGEYRGLVLMLLLRQPPSCSP